MQSLRELFLDNLKRAQWLPPIPTPAQGDPDQALKLYSVPKAMHVVYVVYGSIKILGIINAEDAL
jgi:hypothetical protein